MSSPKTDGVDGVFALITDICNRTASKYASQSKIPRDQLVSKMRSCAYELLLKKSHETFSTRAEPIIDLLSYYYTCQTNVKNVAEYKKSHELKKIISKIRETNFGDSKDNFNQVLKLLVGLSDSVKQDHSSELFRKPFTFGLLDEMLPRPQKQGSSQPYPYYPTHVFELPFSLKAEASPELQQSPSNLYIVDSYDSKSRLPDLRTGERVEIRSHLSPLSLLSLSSTQVSPSPYSHNTGFKLARLTAPRDLKIPSSDNILDPKPMVSFPTVDSGEVKEVYRARSPDAMVDIWELATQIDKDIPDDIWEIVSKMPPIEERQLIATSPREMALWHRIYADTLEDFSIVTEKQFIRDVMYLTFGIGTKSFPFSEELNVFYMKENLVLEGISKEMLRGYVNDLLAIGTFYRRLFNLAFNQTLEDHYHSKGLVYEAAREVIRRYLLEFRLKATEIYEQNTGSGSRTDCTRMPTLLQILFHMEPLKYEIETIASIYKLIETGPKVTIPLGAELMSYLFSEISMVTHKMTATTLFNALFTICGVYFKFIERFIFEGELDDHLNEFFIRKDTAYVNTRSKRYWDKGFYISEGLAVPEFLRPLAKFILLCGKSLRLLKHCNPSDPLVLLISSDHPSIKCCGCFEELDRQQQILDVYRTRCLFVSGDPVTFDQILLKKEAARKAFTEMASLKQAETMEKIVAERKRLAQLIIAEKQHSLRVLEQAMAEAKAARLRARERDKRRCVLERDAQIAKEEVDSKIRNDEKNKMLEYYSKLNQEVEKSKIHTEWKIKRLQLDKSRIQMLSTEERNLKREKLELEHQRAEELMSISMQSSDTVQSVETKSEDEIEIKTENQEEQKNEEEIKQNEPKCGEMESNRFKSISSSHVVSAICNAAMSFFGSKTVDNKKDVDAQGNVVPVDSENNKASENNSNLKNMTSSGVIGSQICEEYDNQQFLNIREEAMKNRLKVMSHEFGNVDSDNNKVEGLPLFTLSAVDEENNVENMLIPFVEAKRNKMKVLGTEFHAIDNNKYNIPTSTVALTDAQKEALINKQKVLGVEYNLPLELPQRNDPANVAQEEAVRNKEKVLGSDTMKPVVISPRKEQPKRSNLTLNFKPYSPVTRESGDNTPSVGAVTPRDFMPMLDLETPTSADIPLEGALTCEAFTPQSEVNRLDSAEIKRDKPYLNSSGFDFSVFVDEPSDTVDTEIPADIRLTPESSPSKCLSEKKLTKYSFINHLDSSYSFENFDPFGVKDLKQFSKNHFSNRMNVPPYSDFYYTHPALIMEEAKKKPYENMFSHLGCSEEKPKINSDNVATMTACLQRSIMLPLTYQLEVVNNSILKYFLVDLDMYEHLRSLKDYFFLMDGEFSKSICQNLFARLLKTLNPQDLMNFTTLHGILDKALGSSISHVHKFSENLSFTIREIPLSFQHSSPDVLQCLSLTYTVDWPLNILLSQEALLRYAKVFQFLLKMRRIFWVLGEDFEYLKLSVKIPKQHSRKLAKSPHYISVQIYRHIMASLIRALDNYIVTTCILTSWKEFENDLKKARTLDDLHDCHVVYIKKVLFRCLLNNRSTPVMKLLNDIFTVILKFSRVVKQGEWQQKEADGHFTHTHFLQIQELFHLFEKLAKYLHKVVTKLMEYGYQRHLAELLTLVNLNGYYDFNKSRDETNTSANKQSP